MIGRKLRNRYEITEHLGDGSTATVYKATDTRLGRDVAIKMLLPHVRDSTRKRFFQEATSAASLNHPNVMAIFDIDEEGGRNFLVIEHIDGVSLSHYVPSSPELVVDLGSQIARALQYAHEAQIIHRDIKPANIQVTPEGQVKLMDLGLALPHDAKRVTAHGMVIGTPAYLSPEQAQGLKLDHRTDIYSLGIVLYEMATGQLPFNADDIGALLLQQVKQPPPPPRLINADMPLAMESVILKALEKNPNRRYQSANAMASALEASVPQAEAQPDMSGISAKSTMQAERAPSLSSEPRSGAKRRTLRIIVADDHVLLRKSLSGMLEQHDEFVVVGEASDGASALEQTVAIQPDLLVLDLNMPGKGGLDVLPEVREQAPNVKVLVLTGREEESYIMRAIRAGAHGYILKSSEEGDLLDAIVKVTQGQMVLGPGVAEVVTGMLSGGDDKKLDDTEQTLMLHVAAGFDNSEISRELGIPMTDMIELLAKAMNKLNAKDRHSAALKALKSGAIMIEDVHALGGPDEIG